MESVRQIQKKYAYGAMTVAIIAGLFLVLAGQRPIGKGLVLGAIFSVINFILIGETLSMRIGKSKWKTYNSVFTSILFRYSLLAVPLILAVKIEQFNLFSTILGIFMIQVVILTDHMIQVFSSNLRKQQ